MNRFKEALRDVGYWLAIVYLAGLAALAFRLVWRRPASLELSWLEGRAGVAAVYLVAAMAVLLALYFLMRWWEVVNRRRRFTREGEHGPLQVSPFAIRDFIEQRLAQEEELLRAHVALAHDPQGALEVTLTVTLAVDALVVDTIQRLQQVLKAEIEQRFGIPVSRITVYAQRIGSAGGAPATPENERSPRAPAVTGASEPADDEPWEAR